MPGTVPANPAIFHITHLRNLAGIRRDGCIWSDAERIRRSVASTNIGHKHIKERRLKREVPVAAGAKLGDYVPFYFCKRSVMLHAIHRGHQDYDGGQDEILHMVSSVRTATRLRRPWAFTDRHAELRYASYFDDLARLNQVDWNVMPLEYWAGSEDTKERRQAEFLVHESFPWSAIERIGVYSHAILEKVRPMLENGGPPVEVQPRWYY